MLEQKLFGDGKLLKIGLLILKSFFPNEADEKKVPRLEVKKPGIERTLEECDDKMGLPRQEMISTYEDFEKWFDSDYKDEKVLKKLELFHKNYKTGLKSLSDSERKEVKKIQEEFNKGKNLFRNIIIAGYQKNYPFLRLNKGDFGEDDAYFVYEEFKALNKYYKKRTKKDDMIPEFDDDGSFFERYKN